jgi:hypothetical protein
MLRRSLFLVVIATALTTVMLPAAVAGARTGSTAGPTLTGPSGVHVGETYTVYGSGFAPGAWVPLEIAEADGCCLALGMVADETGGFTLIRLAWAPGSYRVRAAVPRNGNGRWRTVASWSFEAYW